MTKEGADKLQAELEQLKKVDRPKVIADIATAREHGDLKENAEYHAAREQQGLIEARISQLEGVLSSVQIIDVTTLPKSGRVVFGTTVTLLNIETDEEVTYKIVGDEESEPSSNKISISSPIARALVGKEEGDDVIVKAPKGDIEYEIISVQYI